MLTLISATLYKNDPAPNERLLTHILSSTESIDITAPISSGPAEVTAEFSEVLSESFLPSILEFEPYTRRVCATYPPESLEQGKTTLPCKEIEAKNIKLCLV